MRIGILGGSFNPIHNGHIAIAAAVKTEFALDKVLFMVANDPPHKAIAEHVDAALRFEMASAALNGHEGMEASSIELSRPGKSYTVDTLEELLRVYAGAEIFIIVGGDMLVTLTSWHKADVLLHAGSFIGVSRPDEQRDLNAATARLRDGYGANVYLSKFTGPAISSSMIRERMFSALPISALVPETVETMIYENMLYIPQNICTIQKNLLASLKYSRYIHTINVMRCAIDLAAMYGVNAEKARLAGLLHDCAKLSKDKQLELAARYGVDTVDHALPLLHGAIGAALAEAEYGIHDTEILFAIKNHTLCREGMTKLEKVTYLADKIERGRNYEGVDAIRSAAMRSLNEGVLASMNYSIDYVLNSGKKLDPAILAAREYIKAEIKKEA